MICRTSFPSKTQRKATPLRYANLPPVGSHVLPDLHYEMTQARSSRFGSPTEIVWEHRWGTRDVVHENIDGVINEFLDPHNSASAHIVYGGEVGKNAGQCVQMVPLQMAAWTQAGFNSSGVSIESADPLWLGNDPDGFAVLARMTAWLLHRLGLPARWITGPSIYTRGFSRHADGGQEGGGHTACPTTDLQLFGQFAERVTAELKLGGFRSLWAM